LPSADENRAKGEPERGPIGPHRFDGNASDKEVDASSGSRIAHTFRIRVSDSRFGFADQWKREFPVGHTFSLLTATLLVAQSPSTPVATTTVASPSCACQKNVTAGSYVQPVPTQIVQTGGDTPSTPSTRSGIFFRGSSDQTAQAPTVTEERPSFFSRVRNFFGGRKKDESIEMQAPPVVTSEPPVEQKQGMRLFQRLPKDNTPAPVVDQSAPAPLPPAAVKIVTPTDYKSTTSAPAAATQIPAAAPLSPVKNAVVATAPVNANRPNKLSPDLISKVGHADDYSWITGQIRIENGVHVLYYATPEVIDRFNGSVVLHSSTDLRSIPEGAHVCARGSVSQSGGVNIYRVQAIDVLTGSR
jgi:hypothetical protein